MTTDIDPAVAERLGFVKTRYVVVERERRWIGRALPRDRIESSEVIVDLYVEGARLRLRDARPLDGGPPRLRLTRKADVDARTRLISSIYLPEDEFAFLARTFTGARVEKLRHRLRPPDGAISMGVDEFRGALAGLVLVEAEFETDAQLAVFSAPDFCAAEVTDDPRYTGGSLAKHGKPAEQAE
jgi:CYTH domain-containing protein